MPSPPFQLLAPDGDLVGGSTSTLGDDQLIDAFRWMRLSRTLDERAFTLQRQGRLGTYAPCAGQEATIVGVSMALRPGHDWLVPQYRELAAMFRHGWPLRDAFLYFLGHPHGFRLPDDMTMLPVQIALAAQIPHAMGLAWGLRQQGSDAVVACFFGEGASSEGDFHEALNFAGVLQAPAIFVLQDNRWAISTPREQQSAAESLADRAAGYGIASESVDGNDLLAVHAAAARAVERGRAGEGATLIEARTYRLWAHNTVDDPSRYVDAETLEQAQELDPLIRTRRFLEQRGLLADGDEATMVAEFETAINKAFSEASEYPAPTAEDVFAHVQASSTQRLARQRREIVEGAQHA